MARSSQTELRGAPLTRLRWRLRGAWLWPSFVVLTVVDALVGHALPPQGDSQSATGAWLVAMFLNLGAILLISPPLGLLVRRVRRDLPKFVARDYAGTAALVLVSCALLAVGLAHRPSVRADNAELTDAVTRAEAYIGDHAPAPFRRNVENLSTYEIQPGAIVRVCARALNDPGRTYCVVVDTARPFPGGVTPAGSEPNSSFAQDAW
jgi:hypothetical protein